MNKTGLIEELTEKLGSRQAAGAAVEGVLEVIVTAVSRGEKVVITGFGSFERRERPARKGRNPSTGEVIKIAKSAAPVFKAGAVFKQTVASTRVRKATPGS